MKKLLVIVLLVFLTMQSFGGGKQEVGAKEITLNVLVRNYTLNQDAPYKTAKAAMEKKFPNVTVNLEGLGYDDTRNKTLITVGANQPLDEQILAVRRKFSRSIRSGFADDFHIARFRINDHQFTSGVVLE